MGSENLEREYEQDPVTGQWRWLTKENVPPFLVVEADFGIIVRLPVTPGNGSMNTQMPFSSLPYIVGAGDEVIGAGLRAYAQLPPGPYHGGADDALELTLYFDIGSTDGTVSGALNVFFNDGDVDEQTGIWTPGEPQFNGDADLVYDPGVIPLDNLTVRSTAGGVFMVRTTIDVGYD